jgi:hypothetical protein
MKTNLRRGVFRIWVVLSVLWIVAVITSSNELITRREPPSHHDEEQMVIEAPDGKVITFPKEMTKEQITNVMRELYPSESKQQKWFHVALWAVSVPLLTCAIWFTGTWILAGFATTKPKLPAP